MNAAKDRERKAQQNRKWALDPRPDLASPATLVLLTLSEVADALHRSVKSIGRRFHAGELAAIFEGARMLVHSCAAELRAAIGQLQASRQEMTTPAREQRDRQSNKLVVKPRQTSPRQSPKIREVGADQRDRSARALPLGDGPVSSHCVRLRSGRPSLCGNFLRSINRDRGAQSRPGVKTSDPKQIRIKTGRDHKSVHPTEIEG